MKAYLPCPNHCVLCFYSTCTTSRLRSLSGFHPYAFPKFFKCRVIIQVGFFVTVPFQCRFILISILVISILVISILIISILILILFIIVRVIPKNFFSYGSLNPKILNKILLI